MRELSKVSPGAPASMSLRVLSVDGRGSRSRRDEVAAEEPLEIRLLLPHGKELQRHSIAVTMRTPGHDDELAAGFLFTEGIVSGRDTIRNIAHCPTSSPASRGNIVNVLLSPRAGFDPSRFSRNVYTTSSCGICGKTSLEMVRTVCPRPPVGTFRLRPELLQSLPERLGESQPLFARTGGLHAAALFDAEGELLLVREDVGRHNAVDKLVGRLWLEDRLPASEAVLLVSGRASFELVQKAVTAGIPALAAVGAPSSLAIRLAREFDMTLVGFLRDERFNVYAGFHRIAAGS